jgi:hypothetical protein
MVRLLDVVVTGNYRALDGTSVSSMLCRPVARYDAVFLSRGPAVIVAVSGGSLPRAVRRRRLTAAGGG